MTILYQDLPVVYDTGELLNDKSTNWRDFKLKSTAVSKAFPINDKYWLKRSEIMLGCGSTLQFAVSKSGEKRLVSAMFCRDRMCPACQKRRSLVVFHQVRDVCRSLQEKYSSTRYLLLTLTVPNVKYEDLSDEIKRINKAWTRMTQRVQFKRAIWGWFKAIEVTYNGDNDTYHPHAHILLAVPNSYFKGVHYINRDRWLVLWQECMKNPLITQVDVRAIKPNRRQGGDDLSAAAAEVGKYATKPKNYLCRLPTGDYYADRKIVTELATVLKGVRLTAFGGRMKEAYKNLGLLDAEGDSVDMVHVGDEDKQIEAVMIQIYRWNVGFKNYVG